MELIQTGFIEPVVSCSRCKGKALRQDDKVPKTIQNKPCYSVLNSEKKLGKRRNTEVTF